jgi:hypothetical protein
VALFSEWDVKQLTTGLKSVVRVLEFAGFYIKYLAPCFFLMAFVIYWNEVLQIGKVFFAPLEWFIVKPDGVVYLSNIFGK